MPKNSLSQFDYLRRSSLSRLRNSSTRCWRWDERREDGDRLCCRCSPTASQIDRLVLRSICSLLSVIRLFITSSASRPFIVMLDKSLVGKLFPVTKRLHADQWKLNESSGRFHLRELR